MSFLLKIGRNHLPWSQGTGLGVLFILPKCSLCVFTVSSSIAVCGIDTAENPIWEYLLTGGLSVLPLIVLSNKASGITTMVTVISALLGLFVVLGFLIFSWSQIFYYLGVSLLVVVWVGRKFQSMQHCKDPCGEPLKAYPKS